MKRVVETRSPEETRRLAAEFAARLKPGDIVALTGPLGSGKTVFAKGVIEELHGAVENFQGSPTFALVQEYAAPRVRLVAAGEDREPVGPGVRCRPAKSGAGVSGAERPVSGISPYSIPVYHFDFYRIKHAEEIYQIGWDEYLTSGGICLVEWADRFPEVMPRDTRWIRLSPCGRTCRKIQELANMSLPNLPAP